MLLKAVLVFLGAMVIVAFIGRALFPNRLRRAPPLFGRPSKPATCIKCGRYIVGKGPCDCGGNGRRT